MRRRKLFVSLGISAFGVAVMVAVILASNGLWHAGDSSRESDLAAPLPEESAADFAAALPQIEDLRQHRGSLLDGSLLDSIAEPETVHDNSYVDLLRREARRLDSQAADREDLGHYRTADDLRNQARQLRATAREVSTPLSDSSAPTNYR
jgi:hypothetical protein